VRIAAIFGLLMVKITKNLALGDNSPTFEPASAARLRTVYIIQKRNAAGLTGNKF
jgi:hypothetical protein